MAHVSFGRCLLAALLMTLSGILISVAAHADSGIDIPTAEEAARVNDNTVGVVFTHEELYHQIVHNMEDELEAIGGLRIVPIMGKNHVQSVYDLLFLRGVDLALVRSDAMEYVNRKTPSLNVQRVVNSIVKISEEKIMVIARDEITSLQELAGKKVSLGLTGSGEYVTGSIVLETLGIAVEAVTMRNTEAAARLVEGEIDAMVYLLKAPDAVLGSTDKADAESIKALSTQDGLHLVAVATDDRLEGLYSQSELNHDDLPEMLSEGESVATYSVDAMLAAYRWRNDSPRYQKVDRFVSNFIDSLDGLRAGPYQPVWERVSMDIDVPNTTRLPMVARKMQEKQLAILKAQEEAVARREERERARAQAVIDDLKQQEAKLNEKLGQKLTGADTEELTKLLDELNKFMDTLDTEVDPVE